MFKNYFKTTLRNLYKNKGFSLLNIVGLAIGITSAALIFLWMEDELSYNDYFKNKENIYIVKTNQTYDGVTFTFDATPGPLAAAMKQELPGVKNAARTSWQSKLLFSAGEKRIYETGIYADSSFFNIFDLHFAVKPGKDVFSDPKSVVISEQMAKRFFGNPDATGKTIRVNNQDDYVVKAVFKDLPQNVSLKADWIAPFSLHEAKNAWLKQWNSNGIITYVETEPAANISRINKSMYNFIFSKDATAKFAKPFIFPMTKWRLHNKFTNGKEAGGRIKYVKLFGTIAWIILLIACINFMNLATARSEKRAKEVGVRKVVGAGKRKLVIQFISESLIISFVATLIAVGLIALFLPLFNQLVEKDLQLGILEPLHVISLLSIAIICGLLAGSYPAFYLSAFNPIHVLKGMKINVGASAVTIRKGLVISQFAISIILIISTVLIAQQISFVKSRELGYAKDQLVYLNLTGKMKQDFYPIKNDLLATGAVENASLSSSSVLQLGSNTGNYTWPGKDPDKEVLITVERVSPEYIPTMGMKLEKGRNFYNNIPVDSNHIIINETLSKMLDKKEPLGTVLSQDGGSSYTVVGVIKDHLYNNVYSAPAPLILFADTSYNNFLTLRMKGASLESSLQKVEAVLEKDNPGYPVEFKFVDEEFGKFFKSEMLVGKLSGIFAVLAIVISCLGLFGLAAYTAERRTKEIGVRKVLGASVQTLAGLLSKDFLQLVIVACLIAFPIAWWYMYRWLEDFEYRVQIRWWIFLASGIGALLIALLTVSYQAVKVAFANPVKSLRAE